MKTAPKTQIMLVIILQCLLLVGSSNSLKNWTVKWNDSILEMNMDQRMTVRFNITAVTEKKNITLVAISTDQNIVEVQKPLIIDKYDTTGIWIGEVNISSVFLGSANITIDIKIDGVEQSSDTILVIVKRPERIIDTIFTASVATFVSIMYINFGCAMDWSVCRKTLKRPIGPAIGIFCQFIFMPLISYVIGYLLFPNYPEMRMGIFFTGISPSGGASNIWTVLLGGNINLSITMTTIGTFVAFGMIPIWLFTLGRHIFNEAKLQIPYSNISALAVSLVIPLTIGYVIQKKCPRLSTFMVRIMKPFALVLILFIVIFAIITNMYLFKLLSWQIVLAGMGLPWAGFIIGLIAAWIFKQPNPDIRAIAIEIGIQNTGIAIFLLRFGFKQPAADLITIAPVSIAIMTPIPLTIIYIIMLIRRCKNDNKKKTSSEKLNADQPINVTTITNSASYSTLDQVS